MPPHNDELPDGYGWKALQEVETTDEGKVRAVVATFDVVDNDGEVITKGAIPDGMKVTVSSYNHDTVVNQLLGLGVPDAPPVGKGVLRVEGSKAVADLEYFMETTRGREAFLTVKAMGVDQAWSFAYRKIAVAVPSDAWKAQGARLMLTQLGPLLDGAMECSPVKMPGGKGTQTLGAKAADPVPVHDHVDCKCEPGTSVADCNALEAAFKAAMPVFNMRVERVLRLLKK
jgi:hypothetical protein